MVEIVNYPRIDLYKREPLYFNFADVENFFANPKYGWKTEALNLLFFSPCLSITRQYWGDKLWELYNNPLEIMKESKFNTEDIVNNVGFVQSVLTGFGLAKGKDILDMIPGDGEKGKRIDKINPVPKYKRWTQLIELAEVWKSEGRSVGIIHGAFDPPHIYHGLLANEVWPYCDEFLVGFDKNTPLDRRKGSETDKRPRYPLSFRMWELASIPVVDHVFIMPVDDGGEDEYFKVCEELGIKVIGSGRDNPYLPHYSRRMEKLGGKVIALHESGDYSSTFITNYLRDNPIPQSYLSRLIVESQVEFHTRMVDRNGFPKEYGGAT